MREKKRHKAELAERDKRIAELEAKVNKWAVLEQGDFDPNDVKHNRTRTRVHRRIRRADSKRIQVNARRDGSTAQVHQDSVSKIADRISGCIGHIAVGINLNPKTCCKKNCQTC